ncbi:hypothetical protein ACHAPJ_010426 [Fusarium lateritium]
MKKLVTRFRSNRSPNPATEQPAPVSNFNPPTADARLPEQPSPSAFPDGVEVLHDEPDAIVDICFVHGLTGSRTSTWRARAQSEPWPKTLLPPALNKARILTYGYDALGGLVCKEAILISRNNPNTHRREVFNQLKGIVFMGTPHKGSWMANWAKIPVSALGLVKSANKSLLKILETDDQFLESIQPKFLALVREQREAGRHLQVACFFEELPLPRFGQVVSKDSATFEGYDPVSIHADHANMVKFGSAGETGFKRLVGELKMWALEITSNVTRTEPSIVTGTILAQERNSVAKPVKHYLPLSRNRKFVGQEEMVESLTSALFSGQEYPQVALVGMGGMGKTQIALHLCYAVKNDSQKYNNCSVIWIPALSMESFEQACRAIVDSWTIKNGLVDPKEAFKAFFTSPEAGNWFLVIDNADDISVLNGSGDQSSGVAHFIPDSDSGRVLFTTRSREVAVQVAQEHVIELSQMSSADAMLLLQGSLIEKAQLNDDEIVHELLQELTFLPLAISQAIAYANTNQISLTDYLRLFKTTDQDTIELLSSAFRDISHYHNDQGADRQATELLEHVVEVRAKILAEDDPDRINAERLLAAGYDLSDQHEDAIKLYEHVIVTTHTWPEDNGLRLQSNRDLAVTYLNVGRIKEAVELLEKIVAIERILPDDHPSRLVSQYELARAYRKSDRTQDAVNLLEHVVATRKKLAKDHPELLISQHTLATIYRDNGQVEEAIELLKHVVLLRKSLAENNPNRLESEHALSIAYIDNGQVNEAIGLLEHVVKTRKSLAEDHSDRLSSESDLAAAYLDNGQVEEAIELLEHVVLVWKSLAENDPDRLTSEHELARAYRKGGRVKEAIEILEHVVETDKSREEGDSCRLESEQLLAIAYEENGQTEEALKLLKHVEKVKSKMFAENHPSLLRTQKRLISIYENNNMIEEAEELKRRVQAARMAISTDDLAKGPAET